MFEFFHPLFLVASWIVGIFGGVVLGFGVICLAIVAFCLAIFIVVWLFITAMDLWSSFSYKRAVRRARKQLSNG